MSTNEIGEDEVLISFIAEAGIAKGFGNLGRGWDGIKPSHQQKKKMVEAEADPTKVKTKSGHYTCPSHPDRTLARNGTTKSGFQRWRCTCCGYTRTDSANTQGRPLIGDRPLNNVERCKRYRGRKR